MKVKGNTKKRRKKLCVEKGRKYKTKNREKTGK